VKPIKHVIISSGVSAVFAIWARSWGAVVACFLSGIFIDLDHHLDYFIAKREIPFSYKKLVAFLKSDGYLKIYLVLHSYEVLFLIWACIFLFDLNVVWVGIAVGATAHVFCDEFANPLKPLCYFLTYRAINRFEPKSFFKKGYHE
jgi:hypothetical protein